MVTEMNKMKRTYIDKMRVMAVTPKKDIEFPEKHWDEMETRTVHDMPLVETTVDIRMLEKLFKLAHRKGDMLPVTLRVEPCERLFLENENFTAVIAPIEKE